LSCRWREIKGLKRNEQREADGMKKVLICGATGFIGRNIAEKLARQPDIEVHAVRFNRPPFACPNLIWHQADLREVGDVERVVKGMDIVIQSAATTSGSKDIVNRPYIHITDNALMNSHILRACFDHGVGHFVFFSCSVMHQSSEVPLTEDDWDANAEMHPNYFGVGWTKIYVEKMCEFFARQGKTKHTVIRHSNIYGPHDKFDLERSHVCGATITKVLSSEEGKIVVWGTGEEERDLLYIDDLVNFVVTAMKNQSTPFELFNVGAGEAVSILDLVNQIIKSSQRAVKIEHDLSQPTIKTSLALDCTKAYDVLGWKPTVPLNDGIARTIQWWRENFK